MGAFAYATIDRSTLTNFYKGTKKEDVVFAVNCGADKAVTDMAGITYLADEYHEGGIASGEGKNHRWIVPNSEVYQTERWGKGSKFTYRIPTTETGKFTLVLKFSEVYFDMPNQKVFDVYLGNTALIPRLDILMRAGAKMLPHDEFFEIEIKENGNKKELYYQGSFVKGGIDRDNKMVLDFKRGTADNPKVNAIVMVRGGKENTHFDNWLAYKKTLIEIQKEKIAKREKEEEFFQENAYDYDEEVDGNRAINKFLSQPYYLLELVIIVFLTVFFKSMPANTVSKVKAE